jgi:hypothetical protein
MLLLAEYPLEPPLLLVATPAMFSGEVPIPSGRRIRI